LSQDGDCPENHGNSAQIVSKGY